jgi:hypothetical protein
MDCSEIGCDNEQWIEMAQNLFILIVERNNQFHIIFLFFLKYLNVKYIYSMLKLIIRLLFS